MMKRTYISPSSQTLRLTPSLPLAGSDGNSVGVYGGKAGNNFQELSNKKGNDYSMWDALEDE